MQSLSVLVLVLFAAPSAQAVELTFATTNRVSQFSKIEFTIQPGRPTANPYDPSDAQIDLEIKTPSGATISVPAFWDQPFEYRIVSKNKEWIYPTGPAIWRARFGPTETGRYSARAIFHDFMGTAHSPELTFESFPSTIRGFIRVSKNDPRFFEFQNGAPFFALGNNLAFIGDNQFLNVTRAAATFQTMSENGANFARIWTGAQDWALGIEARKSAWGRSWNWNPPLVAVPDYHSDELCLRLDAERTLTLSPSENVPLKPGTNYTFTGLAKFDADTELSLLNSTVRKEKSEWTRFAIPMTADQWFLGDLPLKAIGKGRVWIRELSLRESAGGPELLWEADPNRPPRGVYNQPDSFMLDRLVEAAEQSGVYLQLCLLTRDHYMRDLADPKSAKYDAAIRDAQKFMRYAVARWGYSTHVFSWEYFNEMDPNAPTERFHAELGTYLESADPYHHLRTTSGWGPAPRQWQYPQLDIADLHWYLRPISKPDWRDEVTAILDRSKLVRDSAGNKPAVLGEFGLADDKWGRSPHMAEDKHNLHFHNTIWASSLSGLAGSASFWWWEVLAENRAYTEYKPLAAFLADIPFTSANLQPILLTTAGESCRVIGLKGNRHAFLWISADANTWHRQVIDQEKPPTIQNASFALDGLEPASYTIQWWNTRTGIITSEATLQTDPDKFPTLHVPAFTSDIACKVLPR